MTLNGNVLLDDFYSKLQPFTLFASIARTYALFYKMFKGLLRAVTHHTHLSLPDLI
jgi:hypothetical protein